MNRCLPAMLPALLALSANPSKGVEISINNWSGAQWSVSPGRGLDSPRTTLHPRQDPPESLALDLDAPGEHIYRLWDHSGRSQCALHIFLSAPTEACPEPVPVLILAHDPGTSFDGASLGPKLDLHIHVRSFDPLPADLPQTPFHQFAREGGQRLDWIHRQQRRAR